MKVEHVSLKPAQLRPRELLITPGIDRRSLECLGECCVARIRFVGGYPNANWERRGLDRRATDRIRKDGIQIAQVCVMDEERWVHRLEK